MAHLRIFYETAWSNVAECDDVIFITWNPSDRFRRGSLKYYSGGNVSVSYDQQWALMLQKLCMADRCCRNYGFVAECAPTTGRLHVHGFVVLKDKIKFTKSFFPTLRKCGNTKLTRAKTRAFVEYHVEDLESTINYFDELTQMLVLTPETFSLCNGALKKLEQKAAYNHYMMQQKERKKTFFEKLYNGKKELDMWWCDETHPVTFNDLLDVDNQCDTSWDSTDN